MNKTQLINLNIISFPSILVKINAPQYLNRPSLSSYAFLNYFKSFNMINSDSDLSGMGEEPTPNPIIKKRGKSKNYDPICSFKSLAIAETVLSSNFLGSKWAHRNTSDSTEGEKRWYYCKQKNCPVVCQLILLKDSLTRVIALISDNEHVHEANEAAIMKNHGIDRPTKEKINHFVEMGCKPGKVLIELRKIGFEPPTKLQLYNYIKTIKKRKIRIHNYFIE